MTIEIRMNQPIRILFVEDIPSDVELAVRALQHNELTIEHCRVDNADRLIAELTDFHPDLVVSDYAMPSFDGLSALKIVQEFSPDTPFIVLTGSINEETAVECMKAGADDYVLKDRITRFPQSVRSVLNHARIKREKMRIERSLFEYRERLSIAMEGINAAIWDWNLISGTVYYSDEYAKLLGYDSPEILVQPQLWRRLVHPDDIAEIDRKLQLYLSGATPFYENEHRMRKKDGEWIWVLDRGKIVEQDEEGRPKRISGIIIDITERVEADDRASETEEYYRKLISTSPEGIVILDIEGKVIFASEMTKKLFKIPRDANVPTFNAFSLVAPEYHHLIRNRLVDLRNGALTKESGEYKFVDHEGTNFWGVVFTTPITDKAGNIKAILVMLRDITEHKQMEQSLSESEKRFRTLFETANDAILILKSEVIIECNQCAATMYGLPKPALTGKSIQDLSPDFQPHGILTSQLIQTFLEKSAKGEKLNFEWRFKRNDQSEFLAEVNVNQLDVDSEKLVQAIIRDITERKSAEEDLNRLKSAIEQTSESLMIVGPDSVIQYVNPAFTKSTGYSRDEVIGRKPNILRSGKHDANFYANLWNLIVHGEIWRGRFVNKRKDGSLFEEEATISPVRDSNGTITNFIAVKHDLSRERLLEDQLHQSQKLEAIGRLAGGVAHDFNNLLTIVSANTEIMASKLKKDDSMQEGLSLIRQMVDRGTSLTRQLLAFSRRQPQIPKIINLNDILKGMSKMLTRLISEDIEITYNLFEELPNIIADEGQTEQVVMNLIVNARDALPQGGKITLKTDLKTVIETSELPEVESPRTITYCRLTISDTGIGMSTEVKEHALEPFFTTKPMGQGTGLGLATVHGIVTQSGGFIEIDSEERVGTSIHIHYPAIDQHVEAPVQIPKTENTGGVETILIVEDEKVILDLTARLLKQYGYKILKANNGTEAALIIAEQHEQIRLVLTDVVMPGTSGPALYDLIQAQYPSIKVLFMSGYTTESVVHLIQEKGLPFLQKPFKAADLLKAVRTALIG